MSTTGVDNVPVGTLPPSSGWHGLRRSQSRQSGVTGCRRVLLVDSAGDRHGALERIVTAPAVAVHHARSASEAFGYALRFSYDVLLIDPRLGGSDPSAFVEQLVGKQESSAVVLSGRRTLLPPDFSLGGRLVCSLTTPWNDDEVDLAVGRALEVSRLRRDPHSVFPDANEESVRLLLIGTASDGQRLESLACFSATVRAETLDEATVLLAQGGFDAVLTELDLPDACGLDAVSELRRLYPLVPVVVFARSDQVALFEQALHVGAQDALIKDATDAAALTVSVRFSIQRQRAQASIHHGALHDELTGLARRTLLRQRMTNALARSRRIGNTFALVYIDLDHFKWINDSYGHSVGDAVLIAVSERLRAAVRDYDTVARLGGDEFAVLLDTLDDPAEAEVVAQRVLSSLARPIVVAGQQLNITASLGVSVFPDGGSEGDDLLRHADHAMYCAKRAGRNTYSLTPALEDTALVRPASMRPPSLRCPPSRQA